MGGIDAPDASHPANHQDTVGDLRTLGAVGDQPQSPSPILRYLDDELEKVLPEDAYARLTARDAAVAATTSTHDFHRCLHCARWAVSVAEHTGHGLAGPLQELKTVVEALHDTWAGVRFGSIVPNSPVVTDVELEWVDAALRTARQVAERSGWDAVPWEQLVDDLIAMEPEPK